MPGALDVGGVHGGIIGQPKVIAGRNVEAPVTAFHVTRELVGVVKPAFHPFVLGSLQPAQVAPGSEQHPDAVPTPDQLMDQVRPDKP